MVSKALLRSLLGICLIFGFTTMGCEEPADDDDTTGDDDDTTGDDDDTTGDDDDTTGDDDDTAGTDADGDGYTDDVDCDDNNADVHPDADEGCDGIDTDCDGAPAADEVDDDADGYMICDGDCDDGNVDIYPGAAEACNGIDDDCDGAAGADEVDADADGFMICDGDCDDADGAVYPGAVEVCNTIDDNCDGTVDEGVTTTFYADADGDTYGDLNTTIEDCAAPSGYVADSTDCDDADAAVYPGAVEVCNAIDDNCDGTVDEGVLLTFYADADGDTFGDINVTVDDCAAPSGYVADSTDCDDADAAVNPAAVEVCNAIDDNCDGNIDEGVLLTFYADADGDTYGDDATTVDDCAAPSGYVVDGGDCDDADATINPGATEDCDGVDNNCDGFIDGTLAEFDDDDDDAIVSYTTISLYVDVAGIRRLDDIDVYLDITHTFDDDLDVFLISPSGTTVELFTDIGSSGDDFTATVLDDEAADAIADFDDSANAPFTGSWQPEGSLSDFDGEDPTGTWTLEITDDAGGDEGTSQRLGAIHHQRPLRGSRHRIDRGRHQPLRL